MVEVNLWVMVDESGNWDVSKDATELQGEPGKASRLVRISVSVPVPKPVELVATVADEVGTGELKVA